ncbi:hypothetical protein EGW08_018320 [Elysia chlorotica]|uniref:Nose resistant-to-fluoxetine protein N-terminal domain-containing protein n=1 Tax=Elysia chlorotica TaxID=188477 RepID=A0A433SX66_ELYCH|nr:hypothetical protein EGW08_018320 [Elysia chlorotica]
MGKFSDSVLWVTFVLLAVAICNTESHYLVQREQGRVSLVFPEAPTLTYKDRMALAGQVVTQSAAYRKQLDTVAAAVTHMDLMTIFRAFSDIRGFTSEYGPSDSERSINNHGTGSNIHDNSRNTPDNIRNTPDNSRNTPDNIRNTPDNSRNTPDSSPNTPDNSFNNHVKTPDSVGTVLDAVFDSLKDLSNIGANSSRCINDTGDLIINMVQRQGWALKFLDAVGKPGPGLSQIKLNFLGDYSLCRSLESNGSRTSFRGNYVTWKVSVGPVNPINPAASAVIQWGVCMPDSCSDAENTLFVLEAVERLGLNGTMTVLQAESHTDHREVTTATILAILILCILGTLVLVGTLADVVFLQWPRWRQQRMVQEEEGIVNSLVSGSGREGIPSTSRSQDDDDDDEPLLITNQDKEKVTPEGNANTGMCVKILAAFSVYTNGSKVLSTTQQPGSITCIHGIRFISLSWVILGHTMSFSLADVDNLASEAPVELSRWTFDAVANAFVSVDTFFTLSGILVSYLTIKEMKQRGWRLNWLMFYFHRFWRLTPPYMLTIVLILGLQRFCGQGPLWETVQPADKAFCEKYWWTNLLYINNLVHADKVCLAQSWYLANDMQFFLVSPLMIIPFYFNEFLGLASCAIFFVSHVTTTLALSVQNKWADSLVSAGQAGHDFESYFTEYYEAPWCRIGPYIVGILTGYLLATKRDRIKLNWVTAIAGWLVAAAVALAVVYGLRGDIGGKHPSSVGVAALYNAFARSAWGACVCWVIVACVTGWGGFVNSFLSWSPFVVLGRLTYMAYLIHIALIYIYFGNQQTLFHFTNFNIAMTFISIIVATYGVSFIFMLVLESPMVGLEKLFLPQSRPKQ